MKLSASMSASTRRVTMVNLLVNLRVLALEPVEIIPGIIDTTPVVITDNWHYCA